MAKPLLENNGDTLHGLLQNTKNLKYFKYDSFEKLDYQEIMDFMLQEKEKNGGWHLAKSRYAGKALFNLNIEKPSDDWS